MPPIDLRAQVTGTAAPLAAIASIGAQGNLLRKKIFDLIILETGDNVFSLIKNLPFCY